MKVFSTYKLFSYYLWNFVNTISFDKYLEKIITYLLYNSTGVNPLQNTRIIQDINQYTYYKYVSLFSNYNCE